MDRELRIWGGKNGEEVARRTRRGAKGREFGHRWHGFHRWEGTGDFYKEGRLNLNHEIIQINEKVWGRIGNLRFEISNRKETEGMEGKAPSTNIQGEK
jgi:hypothetical protein